MKIAIFIRVFAYAYPLLYGNKQRILFSCIKNEKFRTNSIDLRLPLFGISFKLGHAIKPFSTIMESRFGMEALGSIARLNDLQLKIQKTVPNVPHEPEKIYDATAEHLLRMWAYLGIFVVIETIIAYFFIRSIKIREENKGIRNFLKFFEKNFARDSNCRP